MSLTTSVSAMHFLIFILKAMKSHFKGSCDKQTLTLVVILYEIYEMATRERFPMFQGPCLKYESLWFQHYKGLINDSVTAHVHTAQTSFF